MLKITALIISFFNIRLFLYLFSTSKSPLFGSQTPAFNSRKYVFFISD